MHAAADTDGAIAGGAMIIGLVVILIISTGAIIAKLV